MYIWFILFSKCAYNTCSKSVYGITKVIVVEFFFLILQAHDSPVRAMTWSHNDMWMLTADHGGYVKYWQSNMNNVKMFQAHKEAIREARFIHNIQFYVVTISMVKPFSKCILGANMHGYCQILGDISHHMNLFSFVSMISQICWYFYEIVLSHYLPLQYVRDVFFCCILHWYWFHLYMVTMCIRYSFLCYCVRWLFHSK